jgi:nitrite reductase/ring-hydroxylating ferredoxin subunit
MISASDDTRFCFVDAAIVAAVARCTRLFPFANIGEGDVFCQKAISAFNPIDGICDNLPQVGPCALAVVPLETFPFVWLQADYTLRFGFIIETEEKDANSLLGVPTAPSSFLDVIP